MGLSKDQIAQRIAQELRDGREPVGVSPEEEDRVLMLREHGLSGDRQCLAGVLAAEAVDDQFVRAVRALHRLADLNARTRPDESLVIHLGPDFLDLASHDVLRGVGEPPDRHLCEGGRMRRLNGRNDRRRQR